MPCVGSCYFFLHWDHCCHHLVAKSPAKVVPLTSTPPPPAGPSRSQPTCRGSLRAPASTSQHVRHCRQCASRRLPTASAARVDRRQRGYPPAHIIYPSHSIFAPAARTAPRPAAAAPPFSFGHLSEQQQRGAAAGAPASPSAGAVESISQRPQRANFDVVQELRWWEQPRSAVTVSGSR